MFSIQKQIIASVFLKPVVYSKVCKNHIFERALLFVFNRVSKSRVKEVGPDRACAEWLLRNGATIKWKGSTGYITAYNSLPLDPEEKGTYHIEEVDGTSSAISHHGFPHFDGCNHVSKMKLINCSFIDDTALGHLHFIKGSLQALEVIGCNEVTDQGLESLGVLTNLKHLELGQFSDIKDEKPILSKLKSMLPNCNITYK